MTSSQPISADIVKLANTLVLNSEDRKIRSGLLWQKQPIIFIFLRHFACIACRAHATQVWEQRAQYEAKGAKLIFIGNGRPSYIEKFRTELQLDPAVVLTDPSLESFRAAGFKHGFLEVVNPRSAFNAIKLAAEGHRQASYSSEAGTHWQLGGVLAVSTAGKVVYQFISTALGDYPPEKDAEALQAEALD